MTTRAAIYCRVSTEEQGQRDLSVPFQLDTCRAYAEKQGWTVVEEYVDVASGKTDKRENFQRLNTDARSRLFDYIVVYKYSRFARNDADSVLYERDLNKKGITLVSATEPIDATTSTGWLNKRIIQTFAEYENRQRSEFVKAGMRQKVVQGQWPWKAPLGYLNKREHLGGRQSRSWVEQDPRTAAFITRLFEEAATGRHSMPVLCDLAEDLGLRTHSNKPYTSEKMLRLLRNPFYKGLLVAPQADVQAQGVHEPLVSEEQPS